MNLFDKIDSYNFECEAGSLNNCFDYAVLKENVEFLIKDIGRLEDRLELVREKRDIFKEKVIKTESLLKEMQWKLKTAKAFDHEELIYKLIILVDQALERK